MLVQFKREVGSVRSTHEGGVIEERRRAAQEVVEWVEQALQEEPPPEGPRGPFPAV